MLCPARNWHFRCKIYKPKDIHARKWVAIRQSTSQLCRCLLHQSMLMDIKLSTDQTEMGPLKPFVTYCIWKIIPRDMFGTVWIAQSLSYRALPLYRTELIGAACDRWRDINVTYEFFKVPFQVGRPKFFKVTSTLHSYVIAPSLFWFDYIDC